MASDLALGILALLLLMAPGWWTAWARGIPLPALAGFIFGTLVLLAVIQILDALRIELTFLTLTGTYGIISATVILLNSRLKKTAAAPPTFTRFFDPWLAAALVPALAVVVYRATAQPLSGVDTIFRWNFLAEQMLVHRTLGFYPPTTASDYSIYAWPDGIAPLVSSLYFWVYNIAGDAHPVLTAPFVIVQFVLLLLAVYQLGNRIVPGRTAAFACALVACSPIVLWSTAIGQESGLLAVALIALLLYLPQSSADATISNTIMAGLAAAMGGLAREYGLAFILFGFGLGMVRRLDKTTLGIFLLTAAVTTIPWYLRTWIRTGNPLFNLNLAGLFPVNSAQERLMTIYQSGFGWSHLPPEAPRIFIINCLVAGIGTTAGILFFKRARFLWAAAALIGILWAFSLSYTSAGFTYSLRVLAPAIVVAGLIGGMAFAHWFSKRTHIRALSVVLFLFSVDASLRALALPVNIYRIQPADWFSVGGAVIQHHQRPVYHQLADFSSGRQILTLGPAALLNRFGAHTIPPWSPDVMFLWDEALAPANAARMLKAKGIDLFLLSKGEANKEYLSQIFFFRNQHGHALQPIWSDEEMTLFQINVPTIGQSLQ